MQEPTKKSLYWSLLLVAYSLYLQLRWDGDGGGFPWSNLLGSFSDTIWSWNQNVLTLSLTQRQELIHDLPRLENFQEYISIKHYEVLGRFLAVINFFSNSILGYKHVAEKETLGLEPTYPEPHAQT